MEEITLEEQEFGKEETEWDGKSDSEERADDAGPGITKILCEEDVHLLTEDETCLVYKKCLLQLANTSISKMCKVKGCKQPIGNRTSSVGSALYIFWVKNKINCLRCSIMQYYTN